MASIRERNGKFNVIYSYTNEKGERKQKWEIYETKAEAKRRKKKTGRFLRMKEMSLLSTTIFFRSLVMQSCQRLIPDSLKDIIRVFWKRRAVINPLNKTSRNEFVSSSTVRMLYKSNCLTGKKKTLALKQEKNG